MFSVSNDLPRTSYIKMVDVWLVFNLFIPFLEVLLHTYKVIFELDIYILGYQYCENMQDNLQVEEREVNHHGSLVKVSLSFYAMAMSLLSSA